VDFGNRIAIQIEKNVLPGEIVVLDYVCPSIHMSTATGRSWTWNKYASRLDLSRSTMWRALACSSE